jgi:hypothetical protein
MSRNAILTIGALLWAAVALDATIHFVAGDLLVPLGMLIVGSAWIGLRLGRSRQLQAEAVKAP